MRHGRFGGNDREERPAQRRRGGNTPATGPQGARRHTGRIACYLAQEAKRAPATGRAASVELQVAWSSASAAAERRRLSQREGDQAPSGNGNQAARASARQPHRSRGREKLSSRKGQQPKRQRERATAVTTASAAVTLGGPPHGSAQCRRKPALRAPSREARSRHRSSCDRERRSAGLRSRLANRTATCNGGSLAAATEMRSRA